MLGAARAAAEIAFEARQVSPLGRNPISKSSPLFAAQCYWLQAFITFVLILQYQYRGPAVFCDPCARLD